MIYLPHFNPGLLQLPLGPGRYINPLACRCRLYDRFCDDLEGAQKLIGYGESAADKTILPRELAPWTLVANLLLNLDEVVNKN